MSPSTIPVEFTQEELQALHTFGQTYQSSPDASKIASQSGVNESMLTQVWQKVEQAQRSYKGGSQS